jgi:hypothetical protein
MKLFICIAGGLSVGLLAGMRPTRGGVNTGDNPTCGADGICNIGVCNADPDCPDDLPGGGGSGGSSSGSSSSATPDRPEDIIDCNSREDTEIGLAVDFGAANWSSFEAFLEADADLDIGNCLENRFKDNGKVVCESSSGGECDNNDGTLNNGWASYLNKRAHFCPVFLNEIASISGVENRKACYFALAAHEWGHTCDRDHGTVERIDDSAFAFYASRHSDVTITLDRCGMD